MSEQQVTPKQPARSRAKHMASSCKKAEEYLGRALDEAGSHLIFLQENRTAAQFHRIFMRNGLSAEAAIALKNKKGRRKVNDHEDDDVIIKSAGSAAEAEKHIKSLVRQHGFVPPATMITLKDGERGGFSIWSLPDRATVGHQIYDGSDNLAPATVYVDRHHRVGVLLAKADSLRFIFPGPTREQ